MRWIHHLLPRPSATPARYAPPSLAREGFVHASFAPAVGETASLYFAPDADLVAWQLDPRRLDARLEVAETPRGPMPHVHGAIPSDAIVGVHERAAWSALPDRVASHRVAFVAFEGMTLLDLVGVHDPVSRLRTMGLHAGVETAFVGATGPRVWCADGASLVVDAVRPPLDGFDLVVIPGGPGAAALARDSSFVAWLGARSTGRAWASVCTGAFALASIGALDGRRAATHHAHRAALAAHPGVTVVDARVVQDGNVVTAGGVTAAIDLGLHLAAWLGGDEARARIEAQMEVDRGGPPA